MKVYLSQKKYPCLVGSDQIFFYRPNTSDEKCMKEVLDQQCYKHGDMFTPQPGQHWLDLGANIGAFSFWCRINDARVTAFEPDPLNYRLLQMNMPVLGKLHNKAVTVHDRATLPFFTGSQPGDFYRATCLPPVSMRGVKEFKNLHVRKLAALTPTDGFDGVKMDIEGAELGMIDQGMLPKCRRLVMEYHLSHDPDMSHFRKRIKILRKYFKEVYYIPSLDQAYRDDKYPGLFDRFVWCWDPKK